MGKCFSKTAIQTLYQQHWTKLLKEQLVVNNSRSLVKSDNRAMPQHSDALYHILCILGPFMMFTESFLFSMQSVLKFAFPLFILKMLQFTQKNCKNSTALFLQFHIDSFILFMGQIDRYFNYSIDLQPCTPDGKISYNKYKSLVMESNLKRSENKNKKNIFKVLLWKEVRRFLSHTSQH